MSLVIATAVSHVGKAYAHFVGGDTKTIDNYKILLLLSPSKPIVGDNSTNLNFSILDKDQNTELELIFAALTIKEKNSGKIVHQVPYKFYEFGDITFPYTFQNNNDYQLLLQTRINGDSKYGNSPLVVGFDISAVNPIFAAGFDQLIIYYVIPFIILIGMILVVIIVARRKHIHH
ncbi:MAG: hypothetical protein ACR2IS_13720 [Nitrososphaeraceae archaeon]